MSDVPEGATISEDGQWWWDGSEWQPIGGGGAEDAEGGGGPEGEEGVPGFDFDGGGLRIDAETSPVPSAGEELKAGFGIINSGPVAGQCFVMFYIDGQDTGLVWESPWLEPGQTAAPDGDGYFHGLPAQTEGTHEFEAWCNPPGPGGGSSGTNSVDVSSPEG